MEDGHVLRRALEFDKVSPKRTWKKRVRDNNKIKVDKSKEDPLG